VTENAIVKIYRFDPTIDKEPNYESYEVPPEGWCGLRVVDTLMYIYENFDAGLSFRAPCCQRLCGSCTVMVNNKPVLACDALATSQMVIEPVPNRRVLKDLVVEPQTPKTG